MTLVIQEMWNKLVDDPEARFGTRVLPEFEVHSTVKYQRGGGWANKDEWRKAAKKRHDFTGFDAEGRATFKGNRHYGIASFMRVWLEE